MTVKGCLVCGDGSVEEVILKNLRILGLDLPEDHRVFELCKICGFFGITRALRSTIREEIESYYKASSQTYALHDSPAATRVFDRRLSLIYQTELKKLKTPVLGFGGGSCRFEKYAASRMGGVSVESLDLNASAKATGKSIEFYDLISALHVLEHVDDPHKVLVELRDSLSADGILFIEVPYFGTPSIHSDGLHREHLNYFTARSLSDLLNRAGLIVHAFDIDCDKDFHTCSGDVLRIVAKKQKSSEKIQPRSITTLPQEFFFRPFDLHMLASRREKVFEKIATLLAEERLNAIVGLGGLFSEFLDFLILQNKELLIRKVRLFDQSPARFSSHLSVESSESFYDFAGGRTSVIIMSSFFTEIAANIRVKFSVQEVFAVTSSSRLVKI